MNHISRLPTARVPNDIASTRGCSLCQLGHRVGVMSRLSRLQDELAAGDGRRARASCSSRSRSFGSGSVVNERRPPLSFSRLRSLSSRSTLAWRRRSHSSRVEARSTSGYADVATPGASRAGTTSSSALAQYRLLCDRVRGADAPSKQHHSSRAQSRIQAAPRRAQRAPAHPKAHDPPSESFGVTQMRFEEDARRPHLFMRCARGARSDRTRQRARSRKGR